MSVSVAKYYPGKLMPKKEGYTNILIHTSDKTLGGGLSPYHLKDEKGKILENIWQFSKWYPSVTKQNIPFSKYMSDVIIWSHPSELHSINDNPTDKYWDWRKKGMNNKYAVRYPAGYYNRANCICSLWPSDPSEQPLITIEKLYDRLDYIEARKKIYIGEYVRLHKNVEDFAILKERLDSGENLQIVEVDGPDPTLDYFPYDLIDVNNPGLIINKKVIQSLVNDKRKPFGHGYVIASLLLDKAEWMK